MSRHTITTHVTGTTRPLPATTTTTTTQPRPRMDATGTAGEEHELETGVSRASPLCFFFSHFFYNYTNLNVAIQVHPPPINLDASNHPRHYGTTTPPTIHTACKLPRHRPTTHHHDMTIRRNGPKRRQTHRLGPL